MDGIRRKELVTAARLPLCKHYLHKRPSGCGCASAVRWCVLHECVISRLPVDEIGGPVRACSSCPDYVPRVKIDAD